MIPCVRRLHARECFPFDLSFCHHVVSSEPPRTPKSGSARTTSRSERRSLPYLTEPSLTLSGSSGILDCKSFDSDVSTGLNAESIPNIATGRDRSGPLAPPRVAERRGFAAPGHDVVALILLHERPCEPRGFTRGVGFDRTFVQLPRERNVALSFLKHSPRLEKLAGVSAPRGNPDAAPGAPWRDRCFQLAILLSPTLGSPGARIESRTLLEQSPSHLDIPVFCLEPRQCLQQWAVCRVQPAPFWSKLLARSTKPSFASSTAHESHT